MRPCAVQSWLPPSALEPAYFEATLSTIVDEWSSHWFVDRPAKLWPRIQDIAADDRGGTEWRSLKDEVFVGCDARARQDLAAAMLSTAIVGSTLKPNDKLILESLTKPPIEDLLERLATLGQASGEPSSMKSAPALDPCMFWHVGWMRGRPILSVAIDKATLVRRRRDNVQGARPVRLEPIQSGLGQHAVPIEAAIGRSSLSLSELDGLSVGDVIIFEQPEIAASRLVVAGQSSTWSGVLEENDGRANLKLSNFKELARVGK